ncbi:pentapeptide repeat-containing protein [Streptomyces sp. H27-D2]|uniref:pentapeptide repeat-containing protein n=1 Tax=Streptomyces sp. H27-D2 TaxID=3046304 RepID=UPI002DBEEF30|nr:pentapeptide repeat-containing protein [Streptomyces sp. H27-D2]MEC4019823.1 pentapeptide repeat-containing protein [Streptomyces sp. H27-D2]
MAALLFTWVSVGQARDELRIAAQGQITNRFNAAIGNLGSKTLDLRLGGIYALQRIMQDSSRDHPAVVSVLSAFVRERASIPVHDTEQSETVPPTDIQAAMTVLANRSPERDGQAVVDLRGVDLRGLKQMSRENTSVYAAADVIVSFPSAIMAEADLSRADLRYAVFRDSDLRSASFRSADLRLAAFSDADLRGADLRGANLIGVEFDGTDLRRADLRGAKHSGVDFEGTKTAGARGLPSSTH